MKDLKIKRSLKVACHAVALAKADSHVAMRRPFSENLYVDASESEELMISDL
jgi:hypothetical protein